MCSQILSKKNRKKQKIVNEILDVAEKKIDPTNLMIIPIVDISNDAVLSPTTVYNHFHSKENILIAIGTRALEKLKFYLMTINEPSQDSIMQIDVYCKKYLQFFLNYPLYWEIINFLFNQLLSLLHFDKKSRNFICPPSLDEFQTEFLNAYLDIQNSWIALVKELPIPLIFQKKSRHSPFQFAIFLNLCFFGYTDQILFQKDNLESIQKNISEIHDAGMEVLLDGIKHQTNAVGQLRSVLASIKTTILLSDLNIFIDLNRIIKETIFLSNNSNLSLKSRHKSERILDIIESVFMKKDSIDASMEEISKFAEISKTTLYKYFSSKTEILVSLAYRGMFGINQFSHQFENTTISGLFQVLQFGYILFQFFQTYPIYARILQVNRSIHNEIRAKNQKFKDPSRISSYFQEFETYKKNCEEYISNGLKDGTVSDRFVPQDAMLMCEFLFSGLNFRVKTYQKIIKLSQIHYDQIIEFFLEIVGVGLSSQ